MDKKEELLSLLDEYYSCERCGLCADRTQIVFGAGNINADIMVIAEAPSREDDKHGIPLLGNPGRLLGEILAEAGLKRDFNQSDVYVTNTVICRPTTEEEGKNGTYLKNREPRKDEIDACRDRLMQEIYIVDPKVILLLGRSSASFVTRNAMGSVAGSTFYLEVPGRADGNVLRYFSIVTWSPSHILRGSTERLVGSAADAMANHIKTAVKIVDVSKAMSQEVIHA